MTVAFGSPEALEIIKADKELEEAENEKAENATETCQYCKGDGYIEVTCPYCSADEEEVCPECDGTGVIDIRDREFAKQVKTERERLLRWKHGQGIPA